MLHDLKIEARVVIAKLKKSNKLHAYVLVPTSNGEYVILDNRYYEPVPAAKASGEYTPLYSFTQEGAFAYAIRLKEWSE